MQLFDGVEPDELECRRQVDVLYSIRQSISAIATTGKEVMHEVRFKVCVVGSLIWPKPESRDFKGRAPSSKINEDAEVQLRSRSIMLQVVVNQIADA